MVSRMSRKHFDLADKLVKAQREIERLKLELSLRVLDTTFLVEIPKEFRVHGQHAAFHDGVEAAWRGNRRDNPYVFERPQFRAWERGFRTGAEEFAKAVARGGVK